MRAAAVRSLPLGNRAAGGVTGLVAGLLVLWPALGPGYLLVYDMVFVPEPNFGARTFGLDGSVPRAVPNDLVVSLLTTVAPGWLVQKALLLAAFVVAGAGVAGLVRTRTGAVAGALAVSWNPYVAERLAIGHWAFVFGYALLPWVARSAAEVLQQVPAARGRLAGWLVLAALCGSTPAVMAALVAGAVLVLPLGRSAAAPPVKARVEGMAVLVGVGVLANAAWWLPALMLPGRLPADVDGVSAFAARADTPLGLWGSLLTGGGIWGETFWPPERASLLLSGFSLAATAVCVGWTVRNRSRVHPAATGLLAAGVLGLLVAAAGGSFLADLTSTFVLHVPGGGLIRDGQKFLAAWVVFVAFAVGSTAELLRERLRRGRGGVPVAAHTSVMLVLAVVVWPVVTLPSLAMGSAQDWRASQYPAGFLKVAGRVDAVGDTAAAVFPWTLYRRYDWNHDAVVLDPWARLLEARVLVNDDLPLAALTVQGEDPAAQRVSEAVAGGNADGVVRALRAEDVRYVVFHRDQPTSAEESRFFAGQDLVWRGTRLSLYDLGPTSAPESPLPRGAWWGILVSTLTAAAVAVALGPKRRVLRARRR